MNIKMTALTVLALSTTLALAMPCEATTIRAQAEYTNEIAQPRQAALQDTHGIVGLNFEIRPNTIPLIIDVYPGTPAYEAHLQPGDRLISVNGWSMHGLSRSAVDNAISDVPGETMRFLIRRQSSIVKVDITVASRSTIASPNIRSLFSSNYP